MHTQVHYATHLFNVLKKLGSAGYGLFPFLGVKRVTDMDKLRCRYWPQLKSTKASANCVYLPKSSPLSHIRLCMYCTQNTTPNSIPCLAEMNLHYMDHEKKYVSSLSSFFFTLVDSMLCS